ncbi:hypothetical protein C8R44DRAFT_980034 [Mycena epipterygia]|nr:hypothetical protein C8R44DRAFT_980034 [Mycena epipterygia]
MSISRLPSYRVAPPLGRPPSYSTEPGLHDRRAPNSRPVHQPAGIFVKSSKSGTLRLTAQEDKIDLPVYGSGGVVEGTVELAETATISAVEVKVEGRIQLKEMGEGGHTDRKLCLDAVLAWSKDANNPVCPSSLQFSLTLPTTFHYEDGTYPLPPSYSIKLKGLPGFYATIDYSISVIVNKPWHSVSNIVPLVNSKHSGIPAVSTPFIYYPRTRPSVPIPSPLPHTKGGFIERPEWKMYQYVLKANPKANVQDIDIKFYLPTSRIFCASKTIPFHMTFESTAHSLAAFLPYTTSTSGKLCATRIQLMRQSAIDVSGTLPVIRGTKTDMWHVDCIGDGAFSHTGNGGTWTSFSGEIEIQPVKVTGFQIPGLSVKDCILFTVTPPNVAKAPFVQLREIVPVRLTTDVAV